MTDWSPTSSLGSRQPLRRTTERSVGGVAAGIAEHLSISPAIVRAMFVVFALAGGAGFLLYLGLWVLIPEGPAGIGEDGATSKRTRILAAGLLLAAVLVGLFTLDGFDILGFSLLALMFAGIALLNRRPEDFGSLSISSPIAPAVASTPPPPTPFAPPVGNPSTGSPSTESPSTGSPSTGSDAIPTTAQEPTTTEDPTGTDDTDVYPDITDVFDEPLVQTTEFVAPTIGSPDDPADPDGADAAPDAETESEPEPADIDAADDDTSDQVALATPPPPAPLPPPAPTAGPRAHWAVTKTAEETSLTPDEPGPPGTPLASITLAAILAVVGVALVLNTLADIFVGAVTVSGISMAFIGIAVAVTSYRGSTLPLVPIAVGSMVALTAAPTIDHGLTDGFGSKDLAVDSVEDLAPRYVLGVGDLELDLRRLELTEDTVVNVEVGTGGLEVRVPRDAVVEIHAGSTVGYVEALGSGRGGINAKLNLLPPVGVDPDAPRLLINADTTIGGVEIYRG